MGKTRGRTRTKRRGTGKRDSDEVAAARHEHRLATNWRIVRADDYEVLALEPGREFENAFDGPDPFWEAVQYAASQLRNGGSPDPSGAGGST